MKITLDQWLAFVAVVENGSYAQAAEKLNKSQSTLSYSIQRIETELGIRLFRMSGRKSVLTDTGEAMLTLARDLIKRAEVTEHQAEAFAMGVTPRIRLAINALFPEPVLFEILTKFSKLHPNTEVRLEQTLLSGTDKALLEGKADLVIAGHIPTGYSGIPLYRERFIAVAASHHPLHKTNHLLTLEDLREHRQIVVSDPGQRNLDVGWLGAHQRWTVSNSELSICAVTEGLGFAWLPELKIREKLQKGLLLPLPLEAGAERHEQLYLICADPETLSSEVKMLFEEIKLAVSRLCRNRD